jgi:hypothetical protein
MNEDWICKYCGKDTKCVDMDYLVGVDHLSCILTAIDEAKKPKVMKIKGWEKISGYTYKGYCMVNPIHNAGETKYMAEVLDLNQSHKPKWELSVLAPTHKWMLPNEDKFQIILWDDNGASVSNTLTKKEMELLPNFRMVFENLVDELLAIRLNAAPAYSSHSLQTGTLNTNYYATNTISGLVANVNNSGTFSIYDSSTGTSINLIDTIKDLQKQIEDLKNTPSNPF